MDLLLENTDPFLVGMELHIGQLPQFQLDIPGISGGAGEAAEGAACTRLSDEEHPFDSQPGVEAAKALDVEWAVLENVYPEGCGVERPRKDVEALRAMIRG